MEISSINCSVEKFKNQKLQYINNCNNTNAAAKTYHISAKSKAGKNVSFGRVSLKLFLSKFSSYMADISETKNAFITMLGTGVIAPFAIMCSPKKPCSNPKPVDEKKDREKKLFQAIRQPISAVLAFGFQMLSIFVINKALNYGAFKAHWGLFKDEGLGDLIPHKDYLEKQAEKILKGKASPELNAEWAEELREVQDEAKIKAGLKEKIRAEYDQVGITLDDKTLEEKASSKSAIRNFKKEKMAEAKQKNLRAAKVETLKINPPKDLNTELVTEEYKNEVRKTFGTEIANFEKEANLKWYDKLLNYLGIKTKKVKALEKTKTEFIQTKGLDIVKEKMGASFDDMTKKLKNYIDIRTPKAQKMFKTKLFWISLGVNLITLAISCVALNWMHPKLAAFIDKCRGKNPEQTPSAEKKVEVNK